MKPLYIQTPEALRSLCEQLAAASVLALDTEFMRETTYYPQLALIQVCSDQVLACIDPVALSGKGDLEPFWQLMDVPHIVKVFHSGRQDLELFLQESGRLPQQVFDSQVAGSVLGYGNQIGYANLVELILGVALDKSHTRTDWLRRPLDEGQLQYAYDDVRYLLQIYHRLHAELVSHGRETWLQGEFAAMSDTATYHTHPEELWRGVKGYQTLRGASLAVLQQLAAWRDQLARERNQPRRRILKDEVLLEAARRLCDNEEKLGRLAGVSADLVRRYGAAIIDAVKRGRALPREQWPQLPHRHQLSNSQEALVDALMAVTRLIGERNSISVNSLTTRKELEQLVVGEQELPVLQGWRAHLLGTQLQAFIAGGLRLSVLQGELDVGSAG